MIQALTLDLDDTLWPVEPALVQAESALDAWLSRHAPATAARFDRMGLRALREQTGRAHPSRSHDLSWLRQHSIEQALTVSGDDPALAVPAFEVFFAARQRVQPYPEVPAALARLAARWPVLAVTNGNADVHRTVLGPCFRGSLSAQRFGQGKPHAPIFHAACEALGVALAQVLHIGDDWALDIEGACAAGLQAAWVNREGRAPTGGAAPRHVVTDLAQLADALGA